MTGPLTEKALAEISGKFIENVQDKLNHIDSGNKMELKALKIVLNISKNATSFLTYRYSDASYSEKYYTVRENKVFLFPGESSYFAELKEWYDKNENTDEKQSFLVYAHAVQSVRSNFIDHKKAELASAKEANDVEKIFEASLIIDTLNEILEQWGIWWEENGCISCKGILEEKK